VGECLEHLVALRRRLKETLFYARREDPSDTDAMIRSTVKLSVNGENLGSDGLGTLVRAGDTVEIKVELSLMSRGLMARAAMIRQIASLAAR
jgi:hypothetical protein